MDILLTTIQNTFNTNKQVFTDKGLPAIEHIDMYLGQPDNPNDFEFTLPALFVEYSIDEDDDSKDPAQLRLYFHLLFEPMGLQYIQMLNTVRYMLKDLRSENSGPLKRNGQYSNVTPYYRYEIISMKCIYYPSNASFSKPAYSQGTIETISTAVSIQEK